MLQEACLIHASLLVTRPYSTTVFYYTVLHYVLKDEKLNTIVYSFFICTYLHAGIFTTVSTPTLKTEGPSNQFYPFAKQLEGVGRERQLNFPSGSDNGTFSVSSIVPAAVTC